MHANSGSEQNSSPGLLLDSKQAVVSNNTLFDYEINIMQVTSPMVVLSACGTGSGKLFSGEGIMSLSRSFLLAGAKSVIHTLWPIDDAAGSKLMIEYYHRLSRGENKKKALQTAKQYYLKNTPPSFAHPYYWAGYQVTGNTGPIRLWSGFIILLVSGVIVYLVFFSLRRRS
jgi:CHAT domain-containing protein